MPPPAIFGAGGHAKVVLESLLRAYPEAEPVLLDDAADAPGRRLLGHAVSGGRDWLLAHRPGARVIPAIGDNRARAELLAWLEENGFMPAALVDPTAVVSPSARVGAGAYVAPNATVNAEAEIGAGAIVNTAASVDHDAVLGRTVHIGPGARLCGGVVVGARTLIGTGACVIPGVRIGADAVVGAGSVVVRDLADGARVAGNPARPI